jgi:hypothetical protein
LEKEKKMKISMTKHILPLVILALGIFSCKSVDGQDDAETESQNADADIDADTDIDTDSDTDTVPECDYSCDEGYWPETDGSPSCACMSNVAFNDYDGEYITLSADSSYYIGGINRYDIHLTWAFDIPNAMDEESNVECTIGYLNNEYPPNFTETNAFYILPDPEDYTITCIYYALYGIEGDPPRTEIVDNGFISLRTVNNAFEGFVSLDLLYADDPTVFPIHVSGPFAVPVPEMQ